LLFISGKSAKLESQFKVNYSIILNMFKKKNSETLEEILGSSFIEAARAKKKDEYTKELNSLKMIDEQESWQPIGQQELIVKDFYFAAKEYLDCKNEHWVSIKFNTKCILKYQLVTSLIAKFCINSTK